MKLIVTAEMPSGFQWTMETDSSTVHHGTWVRAALMELIVHANVVITDAKLVDVDGEELIVDVDRMLAAQNLHA